MDYKGALLKLLKHPLTLIVCAGLVVVGLYYLMSPYQGCLRHYQEYEANRTSVPQSIEVMLLKRKWYCKNREGVSW